ncbi:MAG: DUF1538 domain-containing protein [Acholeplasmatales bacterium]|jgi:hypothetical protein|nr:DUF1538 domain-containing protein [Acholeplasmatales bacterium]
MKKILNVFYQKLKESTKSILPSVVVIFLVSIFAKIPFFNTELPGYKDLFGFILCAILLIIGLSLFTIGANTSMISIAQKIGEAINKKRSIVFVIAIGAIIGLLITIAEPSLWVLSDQFPMSSIVLILVVAIGVAVFLVISLLRIIFQINMRIIIIVFYGLIFLAIFLIPLFKPEFASFIPFSFDASGVTTGPMAVPFIISIGMGLSGSRSDKKSSEDAFGLVGVASIGPIISIIILGLSVSGLNNQETVALTVSDYFIKNLANVGIAIIPFVVFFFIFNFFAFHLDKKNILKISIGFLLTYVGLVIFLTGASGGFVSIGYQIGGIIAKLPYNWILIPLGLIFGFVVVAAEPSVIVLNEQVETISSGTITKKTMMLFMSIGVSIAIGLSITRILYKIPILWIIGPGYLSAVILSFFSPKVFTAIAFDSGGAVSGAMTSTFLTTFALGAAESLYGTNDQSIFLYAFGLVALVAMTPIISIQILGLMYKFKLRKNKVVAVQDEEIIDLEREEKNEIIS